MQLAILRSIDRSLHSVQVQPSSLPVGGPSTCWMAQQTMPSWVQPGSNSRPILLSSTACLSSTGIVLPSQEPGLHGTPRGDLAMLSDMCDLCMQYNDVCWEGAPDDWQDLNKVFPTGNMTFAGEW